MASISSMGIGSGIDIKGLIDKLVSAEAQPVVARLNRSEAKFQAEISAYGNLRSAVSSFRSVVQTLDEAGAFQKTAVKSSDNDLLSATASPGAQPGRYDVTVTHLARAQSLASATSLSDATSALGSGTLTFKFGSVTTDDVDGSVTAFTQDTDQGTATVTIDPSSNTLADVRDAVNEADIGVRASIVDDGTGKRLVFKSEETGAANGFVVEVADDDGDDTDASGLSQLAFNTTATRLQQTQTAEDAALTIDGLAITSTTNTVSNAIEGLTLTLGSADANTTATLEVSRNTGAVRKNVSDFVEAYNELRTEINSLTAYNPETGERGPLVGDTAVRSIESSLRHIMAQRVSGLDGEVRSLTDIGITTERDGTLALDDEALDQALTEHFEDVGALFAPLGVASSDLVELSDQTTGTAPGEYAVEVTQAATRGEYNGDALAAAFPLTIANADDYNFKVRIDGVLSRSITLTEQAYADGDELAAEIQSRLNGDENLSAEGVALAVSYDSANNRFDIRSDTYGADSTVEIHSADASAATTLGLAVREGTAGLDVAGTIGGIAAEGDGRTLTATAGDGLGLSLTITATSAGDYGTVRFSRGISGELDAAIENALESDGILDSRTTGLQSSIDALTPEREQLERRLEAMRERLVAQFTRMDQLVASLNQTSTYLSQQLASLPGPSSEG